MPDDPRRRPLAEDRLVSIVIPVKSLGSAKSRLALTVDARAELAEQLMRHSVSTALRVERVSQVVVVTSDVRVAAVAAELGAQFVSEPEGGLNAAAACGVAWVRAVRPDDDAIVMVSDLPALTAADLDGAIDEFRALGRPMMVADHLGFGTTSLFQAPADNLSMLFGADSAARHQAAGYTAASGQLAGLRQDLDTLDDLTSLRRESGTAHSA